MTTDDTTWALVTGAAGGIGAAIVERLLEAGHRVAATDRAGLDRLDQLDRRYGERLDRAESDVCDPAAIERLVASLEERGPIGAVVTVAGVQKTGASEDYALADWNRILHVNLTGTWIPIQSVLRRFVQRGEGRVVTISSEIGLSGAPYYAA
ncbi:MAG: SDR family oxidoreductase, partial [Actinomycetota bacterium]|nr:SDR family oxidoreductase [Actinomycetota bacterium]